MGFQEESNGTSSSLDEVKSGLDASSQSGTVVQSKENYSSGDELTPKARKPYTITKQRERWTEEEHTKFLEALRLYGRDWRRIEEHVGTKTAVQIRSHAQKFFSKVVKESSSSEAGSTKPIEIPPPRPKRKPMHPYPRKLVNSSKKQVLGLEKPERSSSPNLSVLEHESGSPTSVLSPMGSDTMGSTISNPQNGSQSPVSSVAGANPGLPAEQDDGYPTSTFIVDEEENGSTSGSVNGQSLMKDLFGSKSRASQEGSESAEASTTVTLKLFGRTVLVTDSNRPSANESKNQEENFDKIDLMSVQTSEGNITQNDSSAGSSKTDCGYMPCGPSPVFCNMQFDNVDLSHGHAASQSPQPWCFFYGGLSFPLMSSLNSNSMDIVPPMSSFGLNSVRMAQTSCLEQPTDVRVLHNKQESWAGSSTSSMIEVEMEEKNEGGVGFQRVETYGHKDEREPDLCLGLNLTEAPVSSKRRVIPLRGFVPYKRSPDMVAEVRDGQRIQLCL